MVAALQVFFLKYKENDKKTKRYQNTSNISMENGNFDREKPLSSDERIYVPMNAAAAKSALSTSACARNLLARSSCAHRVLGIPSF